jgi:hypothetical protein
MLSETRVSARHRRMLPARGCDMAVVRLIPCLQTSDVSLWAIADNPIELTAPLADRIVPRTHVLLGFDETELSFALVSGAILVHWWMLLLGAAGASIIPRGWRHDMPYVGIRGQQYPSALIVHTPKQVAKFYHESGLS